jgi:stage II sporulation protein GA (sporulation sigma-E factor processing peptidase)
MGETVYADLLFLINFSMDFLCFYIVCRIRKRPFLLLRTGISAGIGGAYAVAALFIYCPKFIAFLIDIAVLFLICFLAMGRERLAGNSLLYGGVSALLGGVMTSLYSLFNRVWSPDLDAQYGDDLTVWMFALLAAAGAAATLIGERRMRVTIAAGEMNVRISTEIGSVELKGFTDSGNLLTDPLGGRAVILCELDAVRHIFPNELCRVWEGGTVLAAEELPQEIAMRLRFIPASGALCGDSTVITAVSPLSVSVTDGKKSAQVDVLLAPLPRRLSAGEAKAILPPGLI